SMPSCASSATMRSISSKCRTASRSSHGSPSAGMQYWQRKLQRSVTESRRSAVRRPCRSTSVSSAMGGGYAAAVVARVPFVVVLLLTLASCGHEKPTQQVHDTVERFGTAVAATEYQLVCDDLLAKNLIDALEESGVPCELALKTGFGDVKNPK